MQHLSSRRDSNSRGAKLLSTCMSRSTADDVTALGQRTPARWLPAPRWWSPRRTGWTRRPSGYAVG